MTKKHIFSIIIALSVLPTTLVFAATPSLAVSGSGDGNNVLVTVLGADANSSVALYFTSIADNTTHSQVVGTTDSSGRFSGTLSTTGIGINNSVPVFTIVNGYTSNSLTWPYNSNSPPTQITFSPANPTITIGQNSTLTVSGGTANYYISSNSNSSLVTANISGNIISYSGIGLGSSVITVCSTNGGLCGTTTITVNNTGTGGISFSPSILNLVTNQSGTVQINGGSVPYTVSIVTGNTIYYSFSGNILTLTGPTSGTRVLSICSSASMCNQLTIYVTDSPTNALTLSPSSLSLTAGQVGSVQILGGNTPYSVTTTGGNTLSTSIAGSILTVSGTFSGITTLNVCTSNGICVPLMVTIGGGPVTTGQVFSFPLGIDQSIKIFLSGGDGSQYYLQSGASAIFLANIYNNMLMITGRSSGTASVTACQTSSTCISFAITVNQPSDPGTGGPYIFDNDLWLGQTNNEVTELQRYLIGENYLTVVATGYFGTLTLDAVKKFQASRNISATGYVGMLTRAALNDY